MRASAMSMCSLQLMSTFIKRGTEYDAAMLPPLLLVVSSMKMPRRFTKSSMVTWGTYSCLSNWNSGTTPEPDNDISERYFSMWRAMTRHWSNVPGASTAKSTGSVSITVVKNSSYLNFLALFEARHLGDVLRRQHRAVGVKAAVVHAPKPALPQEANIGTGFSSGAK